MSMLTLLTRNRISPEESRLSDVIVMEHVRRQRISQFTTHIHPECAANN